MQPRGPDVAIIGAGLAGLTAARRLVAAGLDVVVHEAGDAPGGRVRTDAVDGFLLDRGFQLLNPAYPEARRVFELGALRLRPFGAGVCAHRDGRRFVVADPRRLAEATIPTVRAPLGPVRPRLAAAWWAARIGLGSARLIRRTPDEPFETTLRDRGIVGPPADLLRTFLSGVLAEDELVTSRRFAEFLMRSFLRGTPSLPVRGIRALPDQLASALPTGVLRVDSRVDDLRALSARVVLVATDPVQAATLLGRPVPAMKALTTFYHRADASPAVNKLLHIDLDDARGPIRNTAVVSTVAPSYAPSKSALIASTVLGLPGADTEQVVRAQAGRIYGVDTSGWELIATYPIAQALPSVAPGQPLRRPVDLGGGVFVAGDHRDTASIQGALVSGRRAADAILTSLRRPLPA